MNVNISTDLMATAMTLSQPQPQSHPAPPTGGSPPSHASTIGTPGSTLSDEVKDSLYTGAKKLEESGASIEVIKSYVDRGMEANGVDVSGGHQRAGQLVDMMS